LGGGTMRFILEILGRVKRLRFVFFLASHGFVFYYGVSIGIRDNSIKFKELQVVNGAFKKKG
jgi:hypothetical protein